MKERPVLFSAPMVRAILDGRKTVTRRVLKQATGLSLSVGMSDDDAGVAELSWLWGDGPGYDVHETIKRVACPYGVRGDRLYVREAWAAPHAYDHLPPRLIPQDARIHYAATEDRGGLLWRPSIHMPRWASRITLEVTGVRCERLRDISEADAQAEGVERTVTGDGWRRYADPSWEAVGLPPFADARSSFRSLWEHINGPGSWEANPWVWVVSFRRLDAKEGTP